VRVKPDAPVSAAASDGPGLNRVMLSGHISERAALRYTPAGLPALDLVIAHQSTVLEEGVARKVAMDIKSVCIGTLAMKAQAMGVGASGCFAGFLATTRNGRGLVFHITDIRPDSPSASPSDPSPQTSPDHHEQRGDADPAAT